ncbi:MAG: hypothetical protein JM58_14705 [Peptococcaceae bacterium BICA1-8]|nr:MAG: hypothetical protein JM58_14705 [Peptococcaceae bacterium BICA1-8]
MSLKILHTSDLHIGMKFNCYPDNLKEELIEARFNVLQTLINKANAAECDIFAIAGDLFEKISIPKRDVDRVIRMLESFAGKCVLILPGNHDFDDGVSDLWQTFKNKMSEKIILLNQNRTYKLHSYDLDAIIYPAPCDKKHSEENNLGWIKNITNKEDAIWHIGIAHGALEGLSPDMKREYFYMTLSELEALPLDLWLLGHTHIPYPQQENIIGHKIFNAGSPEPDGMDCNNEGHAWMIDIDENKKTRAHRITIGSFRFIDSVEIVEDYGSFESLKAKYLNDMANKILLRLKLQGRVDLDLFRRKEIFYEEFMKKLAYFYIDDSNLRIKITGEVIDREFTAGSFPHQFLTELFKENKEETLQIAYELIQEVKAL